MSSMRKLFTFLSGVVAFTALALTGASQAAPQPVTANTTLDHLQAAFDGESNAHARYLAFAAKADDEGYHQAASLFRAAATAEAIHASNHARVIRTMGAEPVAKLTKPDVKTTRENLAGAIAGESYERDTMYPDFIKAAELEGRPEAVRTFTYARSAEAHHAALYGEALANLESWREGTRTFYVCGVCGETLTIMPDARCPTCKTSKDKFQVVS